MIRSSERLRVWHQLAGGCAAILLLGAGSASAVAQPATPSNIAPAAADQQHAVDDDHGAADEHDADDEDGTDEEPDADATQQVAGAVLRWGLTAVATSGAPFGDCNFFSAGLAGDTESSRRWTKADGFYSGHHQDVRIERLDTDGQATTVTWKNRCQMPDGTEPTWNTSTQEQIVMSGGTGTVAPESGALQITWYGSFTVAFYGGMTYWSATDPELEVAADGTGTLQATVSGYAADRDDPLQWSQLEPRVVHLATISDAQIEDDRLTVTPDYLGVEVEGVGQQPKKDGDPKTWGAFPQDFVDFQVLTGQSTYWVTSNSRDDAHKLPLPLTVSLDPSDDDPPPAEGEDPVDPPKNTVTKPPKKKYDQQKKKHHASKKKDRAAKNGDPSATKDDTAATNSQNSPASSPPTAPEPPPATGSDPSEVDALPQTNEAALHPDTTRLAAMVAAQGPVDTEAARPATKPERAQPDAAAQSITSNDAVFLGCALWLGAGAAAVGTRRPGGRPGRR